MREKRRYKRFTVNIVGISGKMLFADKVEILDISVGGVSVKVDKRLNIGNEYLLKMDDGGKTICLKGSVIWSMMSGTKKGLREDLIPLYTAGMRFMNMTGERLAELTRFIQERESCLRQSSGSPSDRRLHLRLGMDEPQIATLKLPENYMVKEISIGGMLIESDGPLEIDGMIPMEIFLADDKIKFLGRVASCSRVGDAEPECFDIGIEFADMQGNDLELLKKFVSALED
jgi:Tfp pilus assembly protein PilZ